MRNVLEKKLGKKRGVWGVVVKGKRDTYHWFNEQPEAIDRNKNDKASDDEPWNDTISTNFT